VTQNLKKVPAVLRLQSTTHVFPLQPLSARSSIDCPFISHSSRQVGFPEIRRYTVYRGLWCRHLARSPSCFQLNVHFPARRVSQHLESTDSEPAAFRPQACCCHSILGPYIQSTASLETCTSPSFKAATQAQRIRPSQREHYPVLCVYRRREIHHLRSRGFSATRQQDLSSA
jgi:hypothetical protein